MSEPTARAGKKPEQVAPTESLSDLEEDGHDWQHVRPRRIEPERLAKLEGYARETFETLGMEVSAPGTMRTHQRSVRALIDATEGYEGDANLTYEDEPQLRAEFLSIARHGSG
jgi:hypothetical protein